MTVPMMVLAALGIVAGALNTPFSSSTKFLEHWLEPVIGPHEPTVGGPMLWLLALIAIATAAGGLFAAFVVYIRKQVPADKVELEAAEKGWYIDSSIAAFMGGPGRKAFDAITWFDNTIIDGAVNGTASVIAGAGERMRALQDGRVRTYAVGLSSGALAVLVYVLLRMSY